MTSMRVLAVALLCLGVWLAGCSAPATDSGIEGTVWVGPTCPVERDPPDPECADRPLRTDLVVARGSKVAASFSSAQDGTFRVAVGPGDYEIRMTEGSTTPPTCPATPVTVVAGQYTHMDVSCDSGIR